MRSSRYVLAALATSAFLSSAEYASAQYYAPRRPMVCTQQFDPVCAVKNGMARTFPNACFAAMAGARVISHGPCRKRMRHHYHRPIWSRG